MNAVRLGTVTCPSGVLVVLDGGCLGMWSGDRSPSDIDPASVGIDNEALAANIAGSVDFDVTGPDAVRAAESFERRPGPYHYDIPANAVTEWVRLFDEHCRAHGWQASLRAHPRRVAHRERALRCAREGRDGFVFFGLPAVAVGDVPKGQPLAVWRDETHMVMRVGDGPVAQTRSLGTIGVDRARLTFADVDALSDWEHEETLDGLADVVFWGGPVADEAAAHFGVPHVDTPGDEDCYGWTDLPVRSAVQRAMTIQAWVDESPQRRLGLDFRPHSHHWEVMRQVRADDAAGSGVITVGGADILFAMTGVGDGFFAAHADYDAEGGLVAVRVTLDQR